MKAASDDNEQLAAFAALSAKVLADAQRSFVDIEATFLERNVHEVVSQLWTESARVTTFIPVLALRDLRERLYGEFKPPQA